MYLEIFSSGLRTSKKAFLKSEYVLLEDFYFHFEKEKTESLQQKGEDILNDGKETIIFAHLFGGILAKAVLANTSKKMFLFWQTWLRHTGGIPAAAKHLDASVPFLTFGGYLDGIVPFSDAKIDEVSHENLWSELYRL